MTYRPGALSQGDFERLSQIHPLMPGEKPSDWMERLYQAAEEKLAGRERREDWRDRDVVDALGPWDRDPGSDG